MIFYFRRCLIDAERQGISALITKKHSGKIITAKGIVPTYHMPSDEKLKYSELSEYYLQQMTHFIINKTAESDNLFVRTIISGFQYASKFQS